MNTQTRRQFTAAIADFVVQPSAKQVLALECMIGGLAAEHGAANIETNPVNDWFTVRFADGEQINVTVRENEDEEAATTFPWLIIE